MSSRGLGDHGMSEPGDKSAIDSEDTKSEDSSEKEERDDLINPFWIEDRDLGKYFITRNQALRTKEGCNRGHGLSAAIKLGTPKPKFLQSGRKVTCSQ